ncbi:MAG TPA: endonuclease Q family protein [Candidatus Binatia bacterium]|nr:endonuclease Q family protein [Candidatus Binatia bacterium]
MRFITDLHIHSRFSRACSQNLTLPNLAAWGRAKGIDILGTSDFTHPGWRAAIGEHLEPAEEGLFRLKKASEREDGTGSYEAAPSVRDGRPVRFMLTTELSCIYKKNGRTRRLHLLVFAPSIAAVDAIIASLERLECNLRSDGRPILGLDAKEIVKIALDADPRCMVVPAHAWTPWFSVFGSESGFDSLEECFEELTPEIHAIETGLSSDPPMNRRLSALDGVMLVSNSDAHGLRNLGREANVFELPAPSYDAVTGVLRRRDRAAFPGTIEFYPEEGKYHVDGHRDCGFACEPEETVRRGGLCPKCGKPLTRGVLGRVHALADRASGDPATAMSPHRSIVPLEEVIAGALGKGKSSKAVIARYKALLAEAGPEFDVLLDVPLERIAAASDARLAEAVGRVREGRLLITPGYDGVYGQVKIFEAKKSPDQQRLLL